MLAVLGFAGLSVVLLNLARMKMGYLGDYDHSWYDPSNPRAQGRGR